MSDSTDIDQALIALLGSDATLLSYMQAGVYYDVAPPGSQNFVIVSLVDTVDEAVFGGRAYEDSLYLVKAVGLTSTIPLRTPNMKAAAARIDALLNEQTLTVNGYTHMAMFREGRVRTTEVDDEDADLRWQHRGGFYRVQQALQPAL